MILGFDTAGAHCAAAVLGNGDVLGQAHEPMSKGQAERLMSLCEEVLADAGGSFAALTALGVGIGPGNFTGIRIAVSAARGLALGLGVPAVGASAFEALRFGTQGPCAMAVDARRDQVFLQVFDGEELQDPVLCDLAALPAFEGPLIGAGGAAPKVPTAVAIAEITALRYADNPPRPAPLYLKAPDAAPARDRGPASLP